MSHVEVISKEVTVAEGKERVVLSNAGDGVMVHFRTSEVEMSLPRNGLASADRRREERGLEKNTAAHVETA